MKVKLIQVTQNPIEVMWTAARTCYSEKSPIEMWEDSATTPTDKKWNLVKKVLDSGHSCYDEETEVLTSRGFKFWKDVVEDDLIATIEPVTHKMHYEKPLRLIKSDYKGKMYLFNNKYINLCVTPNHRLYTSLINSINDRKVENFNFYKCEDHVYKTQKATNVEVALRPQKFKTFCEIDSERWYNPLNLPEDKLLAFNKLIGFFIGDGYTDGGNRLEFHLKKMRKIDYLKDITNSLGWELREYTNNKYKVFVNNIGTFARNTYYDVTGNKLIPLDLLSCSKECINAFVDGLMNSDGSHYKDSSFTYSTTSIQVSDVLQTLVHIIGGHASITCTKNKLLNDNWKQCLKLEICTPNTRSYILVNDSRHKQKDVSAIDYNGKIYCCEVSTGLLMVRRNNKICLCGNSIAEHVYFTFAIEGVNRALTHQLVRHRIGVVYSQQSQRYVNEKNGFEFEVPQSIQKIDELHNEFYALMQHIQNFYNKAIEYDIKPEDARSVLPNAALSNITLSINLRELIHICNLRLCTRAQKEIRDLFGLIVKEVKGVDERLASYLVPQCEVHSICFEDKCCGRKPKFSEMFAKNSKE